MAREGEKIDIGYNDTQILYEALSAYAKQQPDLSKAEHAITLADIFYDILVRNAEFHLICVTSNL